MTLALLYIAQHVEQYIIKQVSSSWSIIIQNLNCSTFHEPTHAYVSVNSLMMMMMMMIKIIIIIIIIIILQDRNMSE